MSSLPLRAQVRLRWIVAVVFGIAAGVAVTPLLGFAAGLIAGWAALALLVTVWVLVQIWPMGPAETERHATAEDPGRPGARLVAVIGSVASLAAVMVVAKQAQHAHGFEAYALAGIALLSVVSSWLLIQTNYLLHYARLFFQRMPDGSRAAGISFNQSEPPQYTDFAYFSVGLGMTYQVADTNVSRPDIRRVVIAQTLLAYLFGVGIIANVVNLVTGLG